jgi:hypothetical protein
MPAADAWTLADPTVCPICNKDSCEDHLPPDPSTPDHRPALVAIRASTLVDEPPPAEIVEGIVYENGLTVMVAESGTGKTFVGLALAAAANDGVSWHARVVERCSVAYVTFEGDAMGLRIRAVHEMTGQRMDHVYIIRAQEPISPLITRDGEEPSAGERRLRQAVRALRDAVEHTDRPLRLMFIDTARASMTGSEDSSESVAAYMRGVRRILAAVPGLGGVVMHHAGWQDGENQRKRERGSSAWRGNTDITLYLELEDYCAETAVARLVLRTLKSRDGEKLPPLHLIRERVQLAGVDRRGRPLTSCVIREDTRTHADREAEAEAAAAREHHDIDRRTIRAIVEHPEATSQDKLRKVLGAGTTAVRDSIGRLIRAKLILPGNKQRDPYQLTPAGLEWLQSDSVGLSRTQLGLELGHSRTLGPPLRGAEADSGGWGESDSDGSSQTEAERDADADGF